MATATSEFGLKTAGQALVSREAKTGGRAGLRRRPSKPAGYLSDPMPHFPTTTEARHLLLAHPNTGGWEYGMLQCLQDEIVRQTGAVRLPLPRSRWLRWCQDHFAQGSRYGRLRRWLPKTTLHLPDGVETLWLVLMGPENYSLDLLRGWQGRARSSVVYLFDTLPSQVPLVRRLFSGPEWSLRVNSFSDAGPLLERATGQPWCQVDQAVTLSFFEAPTLEGRPIHFSAYGRRHPKVHEAVRAFCRKCGLYYDFTTHDRSGPTADPLTLFRQYAWHLSHSLFTFCWPVEVTHPARAGNLSPITCRWFEAAAAGAVALGQAPKNPHFREIFGEDFVTPIGLGGSAEDILRALEGIWRNREALFDRATAIRQRLAPTLDWSCRVQRMQQMVQERASRQRHGPEGRRPCLLPPGASHIHA